MMKKQIQKSNKRVKKERIVCEYGLADCFKFYNETAIYDKFRSKYLTDAENLKVNRELYMSICKDALKLIGHRLIYDSKVIRLPYLNDISIIKRKLSIRALKNKQRSIVNWKLSKKIGKKVVFLNEERDYYVYKIIWNKYEVKIPHRTFYTFIAARPLKRKVADALRGSKSIDFPEPVGNTYPRYTK